MLHSIPEGESDMIVEVNERGELVLPPELVLAAPYTRLDADRRGNAVVLKPVAAAPVKCPPLHDLPTFSGVPGNPNATFRREEIYDDNGR
jgi:hypothetical protein